jgi:hypothetical protein
MWVIVVVFLSWVGKYLVSLDKKHLYPTFCRLAILVVTMAACILALMVGTEQGK